MRLALKSLFFAGFLLFAGLFAASGALAASTEAAPAEAAYAVPLDSMTALIGLKISNIRIITTRVNEDVVRDMLRVQEGDVYKAETLDAIRARLDQSRLFRKITVVASRSASADGAGGGVDIDLNLWDGWFWVPFPFIMSGGGGLNMSLLLIERNYFRRAETASLFVGGNRDGEFGSASLQIASYNLSARHARRETRVWNYADGGFNTSGRFRSSHDESEPERFGAIQNEYHRMLREGGLDIRRPIYRGLLGSLGFAFQRNDYGELARGALPADTGSANGMTAGLSYVFRGRRSLGYFEPGFSFSEFGSIFGMGLADLDRRIQRLPARAAQLELDWNMEQMDRAFGSDFNYTKMSVGAQPSVRFPDRQTFVLRTRFASAMREDLPVNQRVATNRELGLRGNYAREYRGDRGAGVSLQFNYPFRRTKLGSWTVESFMEGAGAWQAGRTYTKYGWGLGFSYKFWRFPLPLGVLYSHSWDDGDGQFNAAIGGRF